MASKLDELIEVWREEMPRQMKLHPDQYGYGPDKLPAIMETIEPMLRGPRGIRSINMAGPTFKAVCKRLKIKHTYKAIEEFIRS